MGRIVGIDFGQKRIGIAITDELKIIATPLETVANNFIFEYLKNLVQKYEIEAFVVGKPLNMKSELSDSARFTEPFVKKLQKTFPNIPIERIDERFTSKIATQAIRDSGAKKKVRQDKSLVDTVSAAIILQSFLEMKK